MKLDNFFERTTWHGYRLSRSRNERALLFRIKTDKVADEFNDQQGGLETAIHDVRVCT